MSSFDHYYEKGIAVGVPDIRTDAVVFFFRDREMSFHTHDVLPHVATFNGCFYEAKMKALKKLSRKKSDG